MTEEYDHTFDRKTLIIILSLLWLCAGIYLLWQFSTYLQSSSEETPIQIEPPVNKTDEYSATLLAKTNESKWHNFAFISNKTHEAIYIDGHLAKLNEKPVYIDNVRIFYKQLSPSEIERYIKEYSNLSNDKNDK